MNTMTTTTTDTVTTIAFSGDLAAQDTAAFGEALAAVETARLVVDITAITNMGIAGAGVLFGAFRAAPWGVEVAFRACPVWARTVRLIVRDAAPIIEA